eukprot:1185495-Prorocentrum_minimum.AAC.4
MSRAAARGCGGRWSQCNPPSGWWSHLGAAGRRGKNRREGGHADRPPSSCRSPRAVCAPAAGRCRAPCAWRLASALAWRT